MKHRRTAIRKVLYVIGSFYNHACFMGIPYSAGTFIIHLIEEYKDTSGLAVISFVPSLILSTTCFAGVFSSFMMKKCGLRITTISGGLVATAGFLLCSLATNLYLMCASFFLLGFGLGLANLPSLLVLLENFDKRQSLALAIATCGIAFGITVFPQIQLFLHQEYGWSGHFIVLAGFPLNMCVSGALFAPANNREQELKTLHFTGFWSIPLIMYLIYNFTCLYSILMYRLHLPAYLESIGHSETFVAGVLSSMGFIQFGAVPCFGFLAQKINYYILIAINGFIGGIAIILTPFLENTAALFTMTSLLSVAGSGFSLFFSICVPDIVNQIHYKDALALALLASTAGCYIGPFLSGVLFDLSSSYKLSMGVGGCVFTVGSLLMLYAFPWRGAKEQKLEMLQQG